MNFTGPLIILITPLFSISLPSEFFEINEFAEIVSETAKKSNPKKITVIKLHEPMLIVPAKKEHEKSYQKVKIVNFGYVSTDKDNKNAKEIYKFMKNEGIF